jgi:hypothetical protein
MVVLFTGISGINIEESLTGFIKNYEKFKPGGDYFDRVPIIVKIDRYIEELYTKKNPGAKAKRVWINRILLLPYPEFKKLWDEAAEKAVEEIKAALLNDSNKIIFVNLHTCYFHNRTQEYLALLTLARIKEMNPAMVVTLIDDVYDIHHRLCELGGIYHDYPAARKTEMILRYFNLLDWRSKETMLSKFIADEAAETPIPHYVLAVKHNYTTLFNLVFKAAASKKVYLSHPITEVRRLEKENDPLAVSIKKEIYDLEQDISASFTAFSPTTIDEYRILNKTVVDTDGDSKKNYYSILTPRWNEDKYKSEGDSLYRPSGFADINSLWQPANEQSSIILDDEINQLLDALANRISSQVTTRDYTLVEQSDLLVIYRPLFNGNASGGVQEEFRYYYELGKNDCFIYCPWEDIFKFCSQQLNHQVNYHIKTTKKLRYKDQPVEFGEDIWANNKDKIFAQKEGLQEFIEDIFDDKIEYAGTNESKAPLEPDKLKKLKDDLAGELAGSFSIITSYRDNSKIFMSDTISISDWIRSIYEFTKKQNN